MRPNNHLMRRRIDTDNIERAFGLVRILTATDTQTTALADSVINNAIMRTQDCAIQMHNLA